MNHRIKIMWLLAVVLLGMSVSTYAQNLKKPLTMSSVSVEKVLSEIEKNSEYLFMFSDSKIDTQRTVSITTGSLNVDDVLKELFSGTSVVWKKEGSKIILTRRRMLRRCSHAIARIITSASGSQVSA